MIITFIVLFSFYTHILALTTGVANLLGFYLSFRKLCLCRCGISQNTFHEKDDLQLLEGGLYSPYAMPWLATVYTTNSTFKGTLISDRHVITAASPLYGLPTNHITVALGVHEQCKESHALNVNIEAVLIHPGYSHIVRNNDIALLRLRHIVRFSQYIVPICMPIYENIDAEYLAWTVTRFKTCLVRIVTLPILNSLSCARSARPSNTSQITSDKVCIGPLKGKSIICQDDIGGPVMSRWMAGFPFRLTGIITSASCEKDDIPLFTKTLDNLLWIHENIQNDCQCF